MYQTLADASRILSRRTTDRIHPRSFHVIVLMLAVFFLGSLTGGLAQAQTPSSDEGRVVESIDVVLANPSGDTAANGRVIDLIRRSIGLFPGASFNRAEVEIAIARASRQAPIASAELVVDTGRSGGVALTINATLSDQILREDRGYLVTGDAKDLPILYDSEGTILVGKLETLTMLYGNVDAWYGRPDLFLNGNPLASGDTAGSGASGWGEGFVHTGLYGLTPLSDDIYLYGGLSGILSGSAGTELFTDESRAYFGIEDAYLGLVGGETFDSGDRLVWNASVGRKRYAIADSMIIGNTASNGDERAALQSNPRWAADMLVLGQLRYNNSLAEIFYLDPDELPVVDSRTRMVGLNVESPIGGGFKLGGSYIRVLESDYSYFALTAPDPATATLGRDGLEVFNARIRWDQPNGDFFGNAEFALQRNDNFDMHATALAAEIGTSSPRCPGNPSSVTAMRSFPAMTPTRPGSNAGILCCPAATANSGCRVSITSRCFRTAISSRIACSCA